MYVCIVWCGVCVGMWGVCICVVWCVCVWYGLYVYVCMWCNISNMAHMWRSENNLSESGLLESDFASWA